MALRRLCSRAGSTVRADGPCNQRVAQLHIGSQNHEERHVHSKLSHGNFCVRIQLISSPDQVVDELVHGEQPAARQAAVLQGNGQLRPRVAGPWGISDKTLPRAGG